MTQIDQSAPVLVTGASGYIASWVVRYLLEEGFTVHATVRDPNKPKGLEHLHTLSDAHPGKLTLFGADLLQDGSYAEAMAGCELVIHTASPFLIGKIRDPQAELIRPALEGTRNVLNSVNDTASVKRVVLTSSVAAIYGDNIDMQGKRAFTEEDWNTSSSETHQPYSYSKTVAEREAWAIQGKQNRWDLVTIHPSLVLGPALTTVTNSGSVTTIQHFFDYSLSTGAPALEFGIVDVRDVALAHIRAGFDADAKGRYIATSTVESMLDIGRILSKHFGHRLSFPRMVAPKPLVKLFAPTAGLTREFVAQNVGYPVAFESGRTTKDLGVTFRPTAESITEHVQQMIDDGLVKGR